jgi:site-specific recombinase XerC
VGPLAPHFDAYLKQLEQEGFLPSSVRMQMYAIARFSKWLERQRLELFQVNETTVEQFLKRDPDVVHSGESAPLRRLIAMLRQTGVTEAKAAEPSSSRQQFIDGYRRHLLQERGLARTSLLNYVPAAEDLLFSCFGQQDIDLTRLTAADVTEFLRGRANRLSPGRAKLLVTALRAFLRYLQHQGEITADLAGCVPPIALWSLSTVPKFVPVGTVQRVLDDCKHDTPDEKRNYAILILLARLGLRACEIVALRLEDIDWDSGRITIRCKGGRWAQLPLSTDVGEAIATYLQSGRPQCADRRVFLRHRAVRRHLSFSVKPF